MICDHMLVPPRGAVSLGLLFPLSPKDGLKRFALVKVESRLQVETFIFRDIPVHDPISAVYPCTALRGNPFDKFYPEASGSHPYSELPRIGNMCPCRVWLDRLEGLRLAVQLLRHPIPSLYRIPFLARKPLRSGSILLADRASRVSHSSDPLISPQVLSFVATPARVMNEFSA